MTARCQGRESPRTGRQTGFPTLDRRGFGILEVLISVVFLSLILLGAAGLMTGVAAGTRTSQGNTLGAELLQTQVEELRSRPFDHADLASGLHTRSDPKLKRVVTWSVTDDVTDELKRVDLEVAWREGRQARELGFRLHLANRSPE